MIGIKVIENCLPKTHGFIPKFKVFDFGIKIEVIGMKVIENCIPKRKGFIPNTQFFDFGKKRCMKVSYNSLLKGKVSYQSFFSLIWYAMFIDGYSFEEMNPKALNQGRYCADIISRHIYLYQKMTN